MLLTQKFFSFANLCRDQLNIAGLFRWKQLKIVMTLPTEMLHHATRTNILNLLIEVMMNTLPALRKKP